MTNTYPHAPAPPPAPSRLKWAKIIKSLEILPVGNFFVIPAAEIADADGKWATSTLGSRVHAAARRRGMKVETLKLMGEGLRIKRVA